MIGTCSNTHPKQPNFNPKYEGNMDEFLKDSPSDYTNPPANANVDYNADGLDNYNSNYNSTYNSNSNMNSNINFNSKVNSNTNFSDFNYDNNLFSQQADYLANEVDGNNLGSSVKSDPLLEDLDSLNFPHNQYPNQQAPRQSQFGGLDGFNNQFVDATQATTNLDELISPSNNNESNFLNPQYFSPPNTRTNYNSLNSIAEDSLSNSFSNTFSPHMSRHGSISVNANPPNNNYIPVNSGSYLSPSQNQFMSPPQTSNYDNSFDTLRSPSFNGSYLNSPPLQSASGIAASNLNNHSTSIPIGGFHNDMLSPPNLNTNLGTSAPTSSNTSSSHITNPSVSTKQLTKEEKLKRRREFHNAVERRRRDLIKERIKELGLLVPPSLLNPQLSAVQAFQKNSDKNPKEINDLLSSIKVKETKPNKSTILNKSVDYIIHLKHVLEQQELARDNLQSEINDLELKLNESSNNPNLFQDLQSQVSLSSQPQSSQSQSQSEEYFNPDEFFSDIAGADGDSNFSYNSNFN